jgi:hypothetical protein
MMLYPLVHVATEEARWIRGYSQNGEGGVFSRWSSTATAIPFAIVIGVTMSAGEELRPSTLTTVCLFVSLLVC